MDAENIFKPESMPPNAAMIKSMPALMSFYGRLRDQVFPDGPSNKWLEGMFDAQKGIVAAADGRGAGAVYATSATNA